MYSMIKTNINLFRCDINVTQAQRSNGVFCNSEWMSNRKCQNFKTCTECLAEWPYYRGEKQVCKWCPHCPHVKCIPEKIECDEPNNCNLRYNTITDVNQCGERQCPASDCDKCNNLGTCIWTRQVLKTCTFYFYFCKLFFLKYTGR